MTGIAWNLPPDLPQERPKPQRTTERQPLTSAAASALRTPALVVTGSMIAPFDEGQRGA
jgi:hypothetical protein